MDPRVDLTAFIGFVGVVAELAGALLLVALFLLLREHAARRPWFRVWGRAWLALAVGIGALALRYVGLVRPDAWVGDQFLGSRVLYAVYQFSKLMFYALLVTGTLMYARGVRYGRFARPLLYVAAVWAVLTVGLSTSLSAMVLWQAPLAMVAFGACAVLLLRLPPSRRSLGSSATAACFGVLVLLWALYGLAFAYVEFLEEGLPPSPLDLALTYNSYIDLLLHMTLGFGMVVLLLEERKREVDDAHAELAVAHDALRRAALYDALTGALNRRAYVDGIGLELAGATTGAVAVVDVDNLKEVNDRFGHAAGDQLLIRVAEVLRLALRASDKLYRWGGDEFLLLLPAARADEVRRRLNAMLAEVPLLPVAGGQESVPVVASVGATDYAGAEGIEGAILRADRLMYEEKASRKRLRGSPAGQPAS